MFFGCSKDPSQRDGSFEYPQHMFYLRNKKNNILLRTLIWGPDNNNNNSDNNDIVPCYRCSALALKSLNVDYKEKHVPHVECKSCSFMCVQTVGISFRTNTLR